MGSGPVVLLEMLMLTPLPKPYCCYFSVLRPPPPARPVLTGAEFTSTVPFRVSFSVANGHRWELQGSIRPVALSRTSVEPGTGADPSTPSKGGQPSLPQTFSSPYHGDGYSSWLPVSLRPPGAAAYTHHRERRRCNGEQAFALPEGWQSFAEKLVSVRATVRPEVLGRAPLPNLTAEAGWWLDTSQSVHLPPPRHGIVGTHR